MRSVWGRMRVSVCVLILAAWALAEDNQDRRSKLPYIADAVGNTLPPPSNVPATVGSPVNLLTPDRYEFYTFDESGELVKRLMTLEEIQAIVAAGEETEGLVTFANDNQPTIAFNFSQPPYTKVHSVVTNVQNVLKAQMEAHKNKPQTQLLDTPDVSDSWSLILPSIFGNTGVDIVPDKTSGSFITPETETIELDTTNFEDENSLGKEGNNLISIHSTTEAYEKVDKKPVNTKMPEKTKIVSTTSTTTTTSEKPTTTTTTSTTTVRSTTAVRRRIPSTTTTTTTTAKPRTTTTRITTTTTIKPPTTSVTTSKSKTTVTTTRPLRNTPILHRRTTVTTASLSTDKSTTAGIVESTRRPTTSTKPTFINDSSEVPNTVPLSFGAVLDSRKPVQYEKVSTFVPVSTINYLTERTTKRPSVPTNKTPSIINTSTKHISALPSTTSIPKIQSSTESTFVSQTNTYIISTTEKEYDKNNSTTITTQSVSPSTTATSTEYLNIRNQQNNQHNKDHSQNDNNPNDGKDDEPILPLFDVAQSISQIASDLGENYAPLPTPTNLLDATKISNMDVESKENLEIDIPADNEHEQKNENNTVSDNFIKISTLDPQEKNGNKTVMDNLQINKVQNQDEHEITENNHLKDQSTQTQSSIISTTTTSTTTSTSTTIDPILSESMEDLLSQVVHSVPESIVSADKNSDIMKQKHSEIMKHENETKQIETENNLYKNITNVESMPNPITDTVTSYLQESTILPIMKENNDNKAFLNVSNKIQELQDEQSKLITGNKQSTTEDKVFETNASKISDLPNNLEKLYTNISDTVLNKPTDVVSTVRDNDTFSTESIDKVVSITSTESLIRLESTSVGSTTRKQGSYITFNSEKNKFLSSSDKNRLSNVNHKEKEPVVHPKVDEFKKKIQKVNIDDKELANERNNSWKLISTVTPPKANEISNEKHKNDGYNVPEISGDKNIILDFSKENQGLEVTTKDLGEDIAQFTELCNELAFQYWNDIVQDIDKKRSFVMSPYSITSMLAMMFMGARGATSGEMNEILKLDDMVTFNPHFTLKNISDSIETSPASGVAISAFIRELYSDRSKGKVLTFYKERAQHFYNGHVEEINFKLISDIIRRRTNLLVKRYTWGKIIEYMKTNTIVMHPPLAAFSANIFQTDCSSSSVEGRDGEMYFVVSPNVRQRRLVPVPAVVYRSNFLAGYDPVLDATAAALGNTNSVISTLFLMPGQQGNVVHAEDLEALEKRLLDSSPTTPTWNRLLRTLLPRVGLELQIPRFSHKSIFNVSSTLRRMGLKDLFDQEHADLGGLNGPSKDLYLSDMIQTTTFVTCGEGVIAEQHHIEEYPETIDLAQKRRTARWVTGWDEPRDYQRAFHDPHDVGDAMHLPLHLRPRQARLPSRNSQPARLKFDRPFLFFVRHNPSGMILYVGRYNPRLLP